MPKTTLLTVAAAEGRQQLRRGLAARLRKELRLPSKGGGGRGVAMQSLYGPHWQLLNKVHAGDASRLLHGPLAAFDRLPFHSPAAAAPNALPAAVQELLPVASSTVQPQ